MKQVTKKETKSNSSKCCPGKKVTTAQCCSKSSKIVAGCHD